MEEKNDPGKGERVVIWLRIGYILFKKAGVGYDLATEIMKTRYCTLIITLIHLLQRIHIVQIGRVSDLYYRSLTQCKIHIFLNRKCHNVLKKGGIKWLKRHSVRGAEDTGSYSWLGSASLF